MGDALVGLWNAAWAAVFEGLPVLALSGVFSAVIGIQLKFYADGEIEDLKADNAEMQKRLEAKLSRLQKLYEQQLTQRVAHVQEVSKRRYAVYDELMAALSPLLAQGIHPGRGEFFMLATQPEAFKTACATLQDLNKKAYWMSPESQQMLRALSDAMLSLRKGMVELGWDADEIYTLSFEVWPEIKPIIQHLFAQAHHDFIHEIPKLSQEMLAGFKEAHNQEDDHALLDYQPRAHQRSLIARYWPRQRRNPER